MSDALAPSMVVGRALAVAWHGPLGPCVARFEAWTREAPQYARTLGSPGADLRVVPALWAVGEHVVAVWCEEEGAFAAVVGVDGAASAPALVHEGAKAIAIAPGDDRATLFCADDRGVVRVELDARGRAIGDASRCVAERRAGAILSAARVRGEAVCAFVHRGGSSLGVIATRGAEHALVHHPVRGTVEGVALSSSGGRAAVTIELGGDRVLAGVLGPDGKLIERPRARFERTLVRPGAAQPVWTEDAFTLLAHDRAAERLVVHPLEGGEDVTVPRIGDAFAASYWGQRFFVLEASPRDGGAELRLSRFARDGSEQQQRVIEVTLGDAAPRRAALASRTVLASVSELFARAHGYRDSATRPVLSRDGSTLTLVDGDGRLSVGLSPFEDRVRLRVTSTLGSDAAAIEAPTSLVRLARWVRETISSAARERASADRAWGEALAKELDAIFLRLDRAGSALVLDLSLAEVPIAVRLDGWLRRLRDEHAARL